MSVNQGTWACREPGCGFSAQSKAGLVNHTRQYKAKAHCCCSVPVEVPTLWMMVQETRDSYASEVL